MWEMGFGKCCNEKWALDGFGALALWDRKMFEKEGILKGTTNYKVGSLLFIGYKFQSLQH